jgi:hypothetical protein
MKVVPAWSSESLGVLPYHCRKLQPDDGGSKVLRNFGTLPHYYTELHLEHGHIWSSETLVSYITYMKLHTEDGSRWSFETLVPYIIIYTKLHPEDGSRLSSETLVSYHTTKRRYRSEDRDLKTEFFHTDRQTDIENNRR